MAGWTLDDRQFVAVLVAILGATSVALVGMFFAAQFLAAMVQSRPHNTVNNYYGCDDDDEETEAAP